MWKNSPSHEKIIYLIRIKELSSLLYGCLCRAFCLENTFARIVFFILKKKLLLIRRSEKRYEIRF